MIFVSVGTHEAPFDRLLAAVDGLDAGGEEIVVQYGPSALRPSHASCVDYLPFDEVIAYIRAARAFVTHAGVGSVMMALSNGKRPIVVPRRHLFAEHVDDHQLELGKRLAAADLVTLVEDPAELAKALATTAAPAGTAATPTPWLGTELREYVHAYVRTPQPTASSS